MNMTEIISAVQAALNVTVDGKAGPETWEAIYGRIVPARTAAANPALVVQPVDPRSEQVIVTLHQRVQPYARALVGKAAAAGIVIRIVSGLRTYAEQDELYAQGRTAPGAKVTNAKGGFSNHNFGVAFDVGVFEGNRYLGESPKYKAVGPLGIDLGLEWGGNWKTIVDQPHYQLRPAWAADLGEPAMLAELRRRKDAGQDYYA